MKMFRQIACCILLALGIGAGRAAEAPFSFIHISDTHFEPVAAMPRDDSKMRSVASFRAIRARLDQWNAAAQGAPKPSFVINTGDLTEFGFAGATSDYVEKVFFGGFGIPAYWTPGNHDMTWCANTNLMRKHYGGVNYAFTQGGVRFLCLNSATIQDPAPSFGPETLAFVSEELKKWGPEKPVILAFHHPFVSKEFASQNDKDRLLGLLRPYNVIAVLCGHGHREAAWRAEGLDWIEGGSTFSPKGATDGYNLVTVGGGRLKSTYYYLNGGRAPKALLDKAIPAKANYPEIKIERPELVWDQLEGDVRSGKVHVFATVKGADGITSAVATFDDGARGALRIQVEAGQQELVAKGDVNVSGVAKGMHVLRVEFTGAKGEVYSGSFPFHRSFGDGAYMRAQFHCAGGIKATPRASEGLVYIGDLGGMFTAFETREGKTRGKVWTYDAGSEIAGGAALTPQGLIVFGTGAGDLIALNQDGKEVGRCSTGAAIYGSPVSDAQGICYAGNNQGELIAFDAAHGKLAWKKKIATQAIESQPCVDGGRVYVGAWDGFVYCVNVSDGALVWKAPGPYCQKVVNRYYAPSDDGPKVAGGKLWVADRSYRLGRYALDGKYEGEVARGVAAVGVSEDGQALYLRRLSAGVMKIGLDGKTVWENKEIAAGRIPTPPQEIGGKVYCVSNTGLLNVLDARNGKLLWRYQTTPGLFVFGGVAVQDGAVIVAGMDGQVTAIKPPQEK